MNEHEISEETQRWLRYAAEDLAAAEYCIHNPEIAPRQACWLAQQSAEKAIKAVLIFVDILVPRTHELAPLLALLPDDWQVKSDHTKVSQLTLWIIEARYPGDWDEPTMDDALEAVQTARTVFETVTADLRQRGFEFEAG